MTKNFIVRDLRNKQFFITDDVFLNGYARIIGPIASMVYISLCRHADKDQTAFPSQELIASELGVGRRTVIDKVALLQRHKLIEITRERTLDGKWLRNTYVLLDKSQWLKEPSATIAHGEPSANDDITHVQPLHTKETHIKYTHIHSIADEDFEKIATTYQVPVSFVKSKYDDLVNYCERTGKRYKNYFAALRNFVKQDAMKIRKEELYGRPEKRGVDASNL